MVVAPTVKLLASPAELIVAANRFEEVQVAEFVRSCVLPSL
jgi:hypothetical protein